MIVVIGLRATERRHDQFTAGLDFRQVEILRDGYRVEHGAIGCDDGFPLVAETGAQQQKNCQKNRIFIKKVCQFAKYIMKIGAKIRIFLHNRTFLSKFARILIRL